ncbi:hypothetical protein T09_15462 [Trichinella sp. T9]|nr:hypothetical protein T09_15462 [Trichinella sp. T9]
MSNIWPFERSYFRMFDTPWIAVLGRCDFCSSTCWPDLRAYSIVCNAVQKKKTVANEKGCLQL